MNEFTFNPVERTMDDLFGIALNQGWETIDIDNDFDQELWDSHLAPKWVGMTEYRALAKTAWQVRKIEARRFCTPVMQVGWRRCLMLARLIEDRRKSMNTWTSAGIRQQVGMKRGDLIWC